MPNTLDAASGRWPEILQALGGVHPEQLTDEHQPCPACGGTDRFRWDDDDGPGGWFCNQCGGKDHAGGGGTGVDLLMRLRDWDLKTALRHVDGFLGLAAPPASRTRKPKRPARIPTAPPAGTPAPALGSAVAQYPYGPDAANPWFWIQRIPQPPKTPDAKPGKAFIHRTWLDGGWHYPSKRDAFTSEWPSPRPVFNLPDLIARPDAPVLVVEGEKSAIAGAELCPSHVVICNCGGTGGIGATDWTPLAGRTVTLWPDADDAGRTAFAKLAVRLAQIAESVAVVTPSDAAPSGWDLADGLATGWKPATAAKALRDLSRLIELPPELEPEPEPSPPPTTAPTTAPEPFSCLGFDGDHYYYQPHDTGQVIRFTAAGHQANNLLRLAGESYWGAIHVGPRGGIDWQGAVNRLFRQQARVGVFNPDHIRGRGAWWDAGRCVLHLGEQLIVDGTSHSVFTPPPTRFRYQRLAAIDINPSLAPLTDEEGAIILDIADRFLWEVPASGLLLAGWTALAPICGALSWRPHAWLTASAGSGKSALLDRFLGPLLDSLALWPEGNTTEAFIRQKLRADAMPVVFDEAESNERADQSRIQNILALARVASSSGRGVIGKGGASGAPEQYTIRSMFMLCSISTALKQGADQSRFAQLTLRNPAHLPKPERLAHWQALDRDLAQHITSELGHRLMLRSVRNIPVIRESVAAFRRAAADRFDSQRQGDQYGSLLAGAWSLLNSRPASYDDAIELIDANNWEPYREASEIPDEERCLQHILQHSIRVELERIEAIGSRLQSNAKTITRTVWELVEAVRGATDIQEIPTDAAEAHLGRIGLRVDAGRLLISNTALGLQRILTDTPWAHSWPTVLSRIPGATKPGHVRFRGLSTPSRAVSLPLNRSD